MSSSHIEEIKDEEIHVISQPNRVKQIYLTLVRSATSEILLIFPTINAIRREQNIGIVDELVMTAKRGVIIKILTPEDDFIKSQLEALRSSRIIVRKIEYPAESKFKLLIIDKNISLVVETKDDSKSEFTEAIGLATLSNSAATVQPYVTIFGSFWRETDLYEKAKEAERIKDEFTNIAAHELRNPIMPIITSTSLLREDMDELLKNPSNTIKESINSNLAIIIRNSTRLLQISEDILQVSKIESGTFIINLEPVDLRSIVNFVVGDIKNKYFGAKTKVQYVVELEMISKKTGFTFSCDRSKIMQTLFNIIDNATKFTEGGIIRISSEVKNDEITIKVIDSGPGLDPLIKDKLFEKFASRSEKGIGLGLYIARKIVEAHGGRIWAENNGGKNGCTFSFTLPTDLRHTHDNKIKHLTELTLDQVTH